MIQFRPFLNSDPPGIVAVWNGQSPTRSRLSVLTSAILEQHVLSKPYFDRNGLIVAVEGHQIVGFAHVGFVPGEQIGHLSRDFGIISQIQVDPRRSTGAGIGRELLQRGEEYLRANGARELLAGEWGRFGPFYFGLYGGSNLPGVLAGDVGTRAILLEAGYEEHRRQIIFQRGLTDFRPPIDRQFIQLRRQFRLDIIPDAGFKHWKEACAWCWMERDRFAVTPCSGGDAQAELIFWNLEPLSSSWGIRAVGLLDTPQIGANAPAELVVCFLCEIMRHYQSQGVTSVECQVDELDVRLREICQRLGYHETDRGSQFRKSA